MAKCIKCGQVLQDDARFCSKCGSRIEHQQSNVVCFVCGEKLELTDYFCPACGVKVRTTEKQPDKKISSYKMISMYEGTPAVGIAKATGLLNIYSDRIEFEKKSGNALGGTLGIMGKAIAKNKIKNEMVDVYPVSEIAELRVGKYASVFNTLVVVLHDGDIFSFCPAAPGSSVPQNIIDSLRPYI